MSKWKAMKWGMFSLAVALAIVLSGVAGFAIGDGGSDGGGTDVSVSDAKGFGILNEIYGILQEDFVSPDAVDPDVLRMGAINGLLQALGDAHTVYIDPESYSLGIDVISGTFEGIGAQVEQDPASGEIVIVTPFRGSPAEKAGVRAGDIVRSVDGESTEGWTVAQAVKRIRGAQGTEVVLEIEHSDGVKAEVTITRSTISVPTVFTHDIEDATGKPVNDFAYIELQQFTDQAVGDLQDELEKDIAAGSKGIILDLRRNPGGGLEATIQTADMFLDEGTILTEVSRDGERSVTSAEPGGVATEIPVVLLVGPGSASGSEVLACALRDNGRATLVGEQTFGKGSVNHLRELSDNGALYVSIARWECPSGEQIEGVGVEPDVKVAFTEEDIKAERDVQLFAAIDYLRENLTRATP
ncbi:MAG TPA: S41 family peptidase [Dehalococcoidia bacterium]|nr:S41 family peptidase [Dehalococcoidia bacterium]